MGQQMGKEAEPPLICSTENPESGHTQRKMEGDRKRNTDTGMYSIDMRRPTIREGDRSVDILTSSSHHRYLPLRPTEQPTRDLELICALLLGPTTFLHLPRRRNIFLKSTY